LNGLNFAFLYPHSNLDMVCAFECVPKWLFHWVWSSYGKLDIPVSPTVCAVGYHLTTPCLEPCMIWLVH